MWTTATLRGVRDLLPARWPGWTWEFWEDRYTEQLRRDSIHVPPPDFTEVLGDLASLDPEVVEAVRRKIGGHRQD